MMMLFVVVSCTEDMVIQKEEGDVMIGVEATFTDELKHHEAILSYTSDFYGNDEVRMVSGATVYVSDGIDTIRYAEDLENKGHYYSELVAGKRNRLYRFYADIPDSGEDDGILHLYAEGYLRNNVERVDSIVVKPFNRPDDTIPTVFYNDTVIIEWVYPYFQSLPDPTIIYMPMVAKNDTMQTDTLTDRMIIPVAGYAGYYINGPEMQLVNKEIPVHFFRKSDLRDGDRIRVDLYSIPMDYLYFYYNIMISIGSNPMLGAPANVATNLNPADRAVGWFLTASVVSAETVFIDKQRFGNGF